MNHKTKRGIEYFALFAGAGLTGFFNFDYAQPTFSARLMATAIPLALLLTVHIAAMNKMFRVTAVAAFVAAVAFTISYVHTLHLAIENGEGLLTASLNPLVFDGMMIAATIALVWDDARGTGAREAIAEAQKVVDEAREEVERASDLKAEKSDLDIMREIWPDRSFLLIEENKRESVVRREVGKARGKALGASRANSLIRDFLADLDKEATTS